MHVTVRKIGAAAAAALVPLSLALPAGAVVEPVTPVAQAEESTQLAWFLYSHYTSLACCHTAGAGLMNMDLINAYYCGSPVLAGGMYVWPLWVDYDPVPAVASI